jgi:hypothetical protein
MVILLDALNSLKRDGDLAAVRDPAWLAAMPEPERKKWQIFWADVDALIAQVSPPAATTPAPKKSP